MAALAEKGGAPAGFGRTMLVVFGPFAFGYYFSYLYRNVNAVVAPHLAREFGAGEAEMGLLTAAYFLSFAAFQIPLGLLLDRYGPRRVQGTLYAVAGLGALLFACAWNVPMLVAARALIGFGVSGGLMAGLKALATWFPRERLAMLNGWYFAAGGVGALTAASPTALAVEALGWNLVFALLGLGTLAAAATIFLAVPDKPGSEVREGLREQVRALGEIYRDAVFWRIVPLMFTCASANMAMHGLWVGQWLREVDGMDRAAAADHLFVLAAGMVVGVASLGLWAKLLARAGLGLAGVATAGGALFVAVQALVGLDAPLPSYLLWFLYGFGGTQTSVVFAALAQHFPQGRIGRVNTAANVLIFSAAFAYQSGFGAIVELWPPDAQGQYPPAAYHAAWWAVVATQVVAVAAALRPPRRGSARLRNPPAG